MRVPAACYVIGLALIALSFPVDGLAGVVFALVGMAVVWAAYLSSRRSQR